MQNQPTVSLTAARLAALLALVLGMGGGQHGLELSIDAGERGGHVAGPGDPGAGRVVLGPPLAAEAEGGAEAGQAVRHLPSASIPGVVVPAMPPVPPGDAPAAVIAYVLTARGWEGWELSLALCIHRREDPSGRAVVLDVNGHYSRGAFQLNDAGKLPSFLLRGYTDPLDVAQQASWLADEYADWHGSFWAFWQPWFNARRLCW